MEFVLKFLPLQLHCLCTKWITVNCNFPTQVQMMISYLNFVIIGGLGFVCVCIEILTLFRYISCFSFSFL